MRSSQRPLRASFLRLRPGSVGCCDESGSTVDGPPLYRRRLSVMKRLTRVVVKILWVILRAVVVIVKVTQVFERIIVECVRNIEAIMCKR